MEQCARYSLDKGKALTDYKEIEHGQDYVCAGLEQYRDVAYRGIVSAHSRQMANLRQYGVSTHASALSYAFTWQCASIIFTLLLLYHDVSILLLVNQPNHIVYVYLIHAFICDSLLLHEGLLLLLKRRSSIVIYYAGWS